MSWSTITIAQIAWRECEPQPANAYNGVNFEIQARATYPLIISVDRPIPIESSLSGNGAP